MNKNNPFEGKAVKFDTAEQLEHLAGLARGYGIPLAHTIAFIQMDSMYFRYSTPLMYYASFCNPNFKDSENTEIHYSDFIKGIEAAKFTESINKTVDNILMSHEVRNNNPDPIARPSHYQKCSVEPIQIWRELSLNGFMGDALKYLMRLGHKDNKVKELTKCIQYLTWEIENIERGILQFTPKDAKCSVSADVIAKELGMSPFIHVALHVVLNLQNIEHKVPALQTAINCIMLEIINIELK